ncbi:MAG: Gfo/Idh/MocA family oxidoreductase [Pseudomonadota bacterium]
MATGNPPRVAVVGCGAWGKNLVRNFAQLGALAAVVDADRARAEQLAETHGVQARGFDDILADKAIAAVAVAAPAERHYELTKAALLAGKDVFVEKPLALAVEDAEFLRRLADETGRVLMVGHLLQYHQAFRALKALVAEGRLGRLQYVYSNRLNLGKIRSEENILWSFAPHDISMILSLVGAEPTKVTAVGANYVNRCIADVTTTHLEFPGGIHAHVFVNWLHPFKEQKLVVVGDAGMAVFDDGQEWDRKLILFSQPVEWSDGAPRASKAKGEPVPLEACEPLAEECRHFLHCVATRERPVTDGAEGVRVLKVLQAADRAMDGADCRHGAHPGVRIHNTAFVDEPCRIGEGTSIWHFSHVLGRVTIGRNCTIGQNVSIGPDVTIGDDCRIQNNVSVYKGVTLEDGVFCGPSCVFTNVDTPRAQVDRKNEFLPTLVKRGATIGANATVVCGVTLGEYCLIGAGAVVTRDVKPHALMTGVPARQSGWVSRTGDVLGADLVCPRTGTRHVVNAEGLLEEVP